MDEPVTVTCLHFTGTVGPVRFTNGKASTADPAMVAYFTERPELFTVHRPEPAQDHDELEV